MFTQELLALIDEKHLLKHPFYQAWTEGKLPIEVMRKYAEQYYHLERNFPNFLSLMLMTCDDESIRTKILDNFNDETSGSQNHRELWLRFGEAIGASREDMKNSKMLPETAAAIETFKELCSQNYLIGAAALAAYESQIPAIASKKIEGLVKHYGIIEGEGIEFFRVHVFMDIKHAQVWWDMIAGHVEQAEHTKSEQTNSKAVGPSTKIGESKKEEIQQATKKARDALWNFLTGVLKAYMPEALEMSC